jgi:NTE family protein
VTTPGKLKVGIALGGGAARGLAHVGVLLALERAGIEIDCVAGTSAGSLIGAFYAAGWTGEQLREVGLKMSWRPISRIAWPGRGGWISFYLLEQWVTKHLNDAQFSDLQKPFVAVATDCLTGNPVWITQGRVALAVHASSAVPSVAVPVRADDGRLLMDGGVSDNVPVRACLALGADFVIASSIFGLHFSRYNSVLLRGVSAIENAVRWAGGGLLLADCVIESDIGRYNYWSFRSRQALVEAGERAAEANIDAIRAAIAQREAVSTELHELHEKIENSSNS